jgi:hypothetical protein
VFRYQSRTAINHVWFAWCRGRFNFRTKETLIKIKSLHFIIPASGMDRFFPVRFTSYLKYRYFEKVFDIDTELNLTNNELSVGEAIFECVPLLSIEFDETCDRVRVSVSNDAPKVIKTFTNEWKLPFSYDGSSNKIGYFAYGYRMSAIFTDALNGIGFAQVILNANSFTWIAIVRSVNSYAKWKYENIILSIKIDYDLAKDWYNLIGI